MFFHRATDPIADSLRSTASRRGYSVTAVSWEDCSRGWTPGGALSTGGSNITDVRIADREKVPIYTLRAENYNERVAFARTPDIALVVGNETKESQKVLRSTNLKTYLEQAGTFGSYAHVPPLTSLSAPALDERVTGQPTERLALLYVPRDVNSSVRQSGPKHLLAQRASRWHRVMRLAQSGGVRVRRRSGADGN